MGPDKEGVFSDPPVPDVDLLPDQEPEALQEVGWPCISQDRVTEVLLAIVTGPFELFAFKSTVGGRLWLQGTEVQEVTVPLNLVPSR